MLISNRQIRGGEPLGKQLHVKGKRHSENGWHLWVSGYFYPYPKSPAAVLSELRDRGAEAFAENNAGEFLVICYREDEGTITLVNGWIGKETCFLMVSGDRVMIGNDLWELAAELDDLGSRIDETSCRELVLFKRPLLHTTIVRGIEYQPPASIVTIDLASRGITTRQYWDFRYNHANTGMPIEQVVDAFYELFDEHARWIRSQYDDDADFGIGLSGGMDSRLAAFFAVRNGIRLRPYIIGKKNRTPGIRTMSFCYAKRVAKELGLDLTEIDIGKGDFYENSYRNIKLYPVGAAEYYICRFAELPRFTAYINGMYGGELWGQFSEPWVVSTPREEMAAALMKRYSYLGTRRQIDDVVSEQHLEPMFDKLRQFVTDNPNMSSLNLNQKFLYSVYLSRNKSTMFEDLYGSHRCNSLFLNPKLIELALSLDERMYHNLALQKEFFRRRMGKLGFIKEERPLAAINHRQPTLGGRLSGYLARAEYKVRGGGLRRAQWGPADPYFVATSRKIFAHDNPIFESIFPKADLDRLLLAPENTSPSIYRQLRKLKIVLDIVHHGKIRELLATTSWRDWQQLGLYDMEGTPHQV